MVTKRNFAGDDCSLIGFGCMRFPCNSDGTINEEESFKMLDEAYANGVNYYDTAWIYHGGESEKVLGQLLKEYPRFPLARRVMWRMKFFLSSCSSIFCIAIIPLKMGMPPSAFPYMPPVFCARWRVPRRLGLKK